MNADFLRIDTTSVPTICVGFRGISADFLGPRLSMSFSLILELNAALGGLALGALSKNAQASTCVKDSSQGIAESASSMPEYAHVSAGKSTNCTATSVSPRLRKCTAGSMVHP